ncbi:MAG: tetratricopeptide repeat protein, partial [Bryobacterales bacterium]|nr:tetratricopeptide repeat protein [Bryobacterales bacterium]
VDVREAGQKLGVGAVVEGSVRKSGDRLRVTAQLIGTADGYHLWSQTYERELKDVFAIQAEISRAIVNSLKLKLKTDRGQRYTEHVEAYNLYLKGRYNLNQYSPGGVSKSIEYFEQALKVDPDYAPAYSTLATVYMLLGYYREIPEQQPWVKSRQAAEKAIQLDPSLAEAHAARGFALAWQDWKWAEAEKEFKLALELDPGSADAHGAYAIAYLMPQGRIEQALAELKQALDIDPNSVLINLGYSYALLITGQCDRAIGQYRRTLELVPSRPDTWWDLGMAYACKGDSAGAMESFRKAGSMRAAADWRPGPIELGLAGQFDAGRKLAAQRGDAYFSRMRSIFAVYSLSVIGERDWAFRYLQKAMKERDPELVWLKIDPRLKNLRDDPRVVPYLKQLGL